MNKKFRITFLIGISLIFCALIPYPTGSPGGKTGSVTDSKTCTQCHGGTATKVTGWITTNIPDSGYIPGVSYTITPIGTHTGVVKFGFELTAEDNSGAKIGSFIITNAGQTKLVNSNTAVTHTSGGNTPAGNSKTWSFD